MIKAYVLVNTFVGNLKVVIEELRKIMKIDSFSVVAGDFDIILKFHVDSLEELMILTDEIHNIKGVKRTNTLVIEKEIES